MSLTDGFKNTQIAFAYKTTKQLKFSAFIFGIMKSPVLVSFLTQMTQAAVKLRLPIKPFVKSTIYKQFCGGETINESLKLVTILNQYHVGAILDYSVEAKEDEGEFDATVKEILSIFTAASQNPGIPYTSLKVTGICSSSLLEKFSANQELSEKEKQAYQRFKERIEKLCDAAERTGIPLYIDAEETWIQPQIDKVTEILMEKYNRKKAVVFTTLQMYRHDRLSYLNFLINHAREKGYISGLKFVRGAYMEKERERAVHCNYPSPINPNKPATDEHFNKAIVTSAENIDVVEICCGTHNENSCTVLCQAMETLHIPKNDKRISFSQLFGMSDNITFNLAKNGYQVTKYLPYGPVYNTLPYLIRRAEENTAIAGQMVKELVIIKEELNRRKGVDKF